MSLSIGVNLRVTGHCNQGGRRYMEDMFRVAYQRSSDGKDLECAFFGIFDGHGGGEAAIFAKEHLMDIIIKQKNFWSDKDEDVLRAIRDGYVNTHYAMWRELDKWPRTASGLPSTAGTTASVAFIRKGKIYIGHVGDSGIILGYQEDSDPQWKAKALTRDHKPESGPEMMRIQESGGKVVNKSGVPRVVWNRPRIGHKGPVRRSTHIDEIPFLAVARSLGDLWSYNSALDTFVVSPEPDVKVVAIDVKTHRCLIFGTDGLWNMLSAQTAVAIVQAAERHNEKHLIASQQTGHGQTDTQMWINPSKSLVDRALEKWSSTRLRADNTSVVTLMLDPPGPSRSEVLLTQKKELVSSPESTIMPAASTAENTTVPEESSDALKTSTMPPPSPPKIHPPPCATYVETKHPDSSNPSNALNINESNNSEENQMKNTSKMDNSFISKESIQVAEISSSETVDETKLDNMENEKLQNFKEDSPDIDVEHADDSNAKELCTEIKEIVEVVEKSEDCVSEEIKTIRMTRSCNINITKEIVDFGRSGFHGTKRKRHASLMLSSDEQRICSSLNHGDLKRPNRRRSMTSQSLGNLAESCLKDSSSGNMSITNRLKRETRSLPGNSLKETRSPIKIRSNSTTTVLNSDSAGNGNKHNSMVSGGGECETEPFVKRKTLSNMQSNPTDENDPTNQKFDADEPHRRLRWPTNDVSLTLSGSNTNGNKSAQERKLSSPNLFQRRNLEKKVTHTKNIRRTSLNDSNRLLRFGVNCEQGRSNRNCNARNRMSLFNNIDDTDSSETKFRQRWLRSDTIAATPIKTLRSRNVDIAGHTIPAQMAPRYGIVKQNRMSLPAKLKQSSATTMLPAQTPSSSTPTISSSSSSSSQTLLKNKSSCSSSSTSSRKQPVTINGNYASSSAIHTTGNTNTPILKRVKSTYNLSARSPSTRSRIKRLGK